MDDDVLPYEKGTSILYQDTISKLKYMPKNIQSVPASCCFFHSYGLKQFAYTHQLEQLYKKNEDYHRCRISVFGWATFIKSNLNLLYEEKDVYDPNYKKEILPDDVAFRLKCIVWNKSVVENHRIAFKRIKGGNIRSTMFGTRTSNKSNKEIISTRNADWKEKMRVLKVYWARRYPNHFFFRNNQFRTILTHSRLGHLIKRLGKIDILLLTKKCSIEELFDETGINRNRIKNHLYHIKTKHKDFKIEFEKGKYHIMPLR